MINISRVDELTRLGLMHPAGIAAFAARQEKRSAIYSFEQERVEQREKLPQYNGSRRAMNLDP